VRLWRASYFLSLAREKVTKERGTPLPRFAGPRARKVRGWVTGFVDSTSCADAKLAGIRAGHPAGCSSTHPPLQRGPGRATRLLRVLFRRARSTAKQRQSDASLRLFTECGPRWPAALPRGPCAAVRRGRQAAKRESTRMSTPFRQDRSPVEKPGPGSRTCRAGSPASAKRGGLSLWLLSLWPHKEKVTRAPKAHESSLL
jgi:hypothetical protein